MEDSQAARVLLIEDDAQFRAGVSAALSLAGHTVQGFDSAEPALAWLADAECDVVLTDLRLPGRDGMAVLAECSRLDADLPVAMMTGHGDVPTAVGAIRQGAFDFIEKPFDRERLLSLVTRATRLGRLARENRGLRSRLAAGAALSAVLCGDSAGMRELRATILRLAPTPVDVLVTGETGTGKELVARALHDFGERRGPFVPVNCAALPETLIESEMFGHEPGAFTGATRPRVGRIEHAAGGTLFLDEIEAMPPPLQAKLLRVLQEREVQRLGSNQLRPVDLRVVAASNLALPALVADGRFRVDLFYRLDVAALRLPPLRERRADVPLLFEHFRQGAALRFERPLSPVPAELAERLLAHTWPGNVRELKSAAERQVLGLPALAGRDGGGEPTTSSLQATLATLEGLLIEQTLRRCGGQADAVCRELALSPATLYRKLRQHGLSLKP
ncbi:MAG: sigma-54-dependent Fis family transcriptional regulator [Piscinibacter sp.]|nr:sigma-54-dependent Fis family transcriptional regulator [Piscinibacter sp.]